MTRPPPSNRGWRNPFAPGKLKPWQAYVFAVLATAGTLGLRLALDRPLEGRPTLVIFTVPIMVSAYVGGLRAGLLATGLSYFAASYYLLPPLRSFSVESAGERWQQFFVALAGVFISVLNEGLHRARQRAEIATGEHHQAETALAGRAGQQAVVAQLGKLALAGEELQPLFDQAVARVAETLGVEYCQVLELLPEGNAVKLIAGVGWKEGLVGRAVLGSGHESQAGYTLLRKDPVIMEDVRTEMRFRAPALLREHGVISGLTVIIGDLNAPFGVMGAHTTRERKFAHDDAHFLQAVANVLAEAVQRKQAELAVRATAQELSLIFNKVFDIVIYLSVEGNERYRFLKVNDAFFKATGLSSEQVLGKLVTEVIPPGSHSLVLEHYGKAIAQKRTVRWAETSVYPAGNKHGEVSVTPVFDKTGTCTHLVGIVHDVTERREAEMATEKERKQLRDVIDSLSIFVGLFSTDGIVLEVNRAPLEASGLSREEVMGKFFWETPPWSYSPAVQARLRDALARAGRGEVVRYDEVVRMAGDQLRVVDTIFSPLRDANGEIVQIVGSGGDITKRQQMEEDLRGSRGELRSLATNLRTAREQEAKRISREIHDQLGQALTGLQMDVTALRRTVEKNGQAALTRKLDEMAKAIDETLQTARRVAAELRPAILDELGLTAAIEWQTRQFEERSSIFCNLVLPAESPVLEPERATAVFRIFQEVLTNVSRHANATEVSVELRVEPGKLVLQVRDNGVGIENIELARMRGHGLVGMQERALEAGFDLEVRSAAGEGTTVIIEVSTGGGP